MQEQTFNEVEETASRRLSGLFPDLKEQARKEVQEVMEEGKEKGMIKILQLLEEELIEAFRAWRKTHQAASGVFHWKVPQDRVL